MKKLSLLRFVSWVNRSDAPDYLPVYDCFFSSNNSCSFVQKDVYAYPGRLCAFACINDFLATV